MRPLAILAIGALAVWLLARAASAAPSVPVAGAVASAAVTAMEAADGALRPVYALPFPAGETWYFTGGPHAAWRPPHTDQVALDFAPPDMPERCQASSHHATAIMAGTVTRADAGRLWLVGDDGRTEALYLHLTEPVAVGSRVAAEDPLGRPSCEGNESGLSSGGAHIHLAVMVDGAWVLPVLGGWAFEPGGAAYHGFARNPQGSERCPGPFVREMGMAGCPSDMVWP